ncbi:MAG TPA: mechanosensitive ion channel family protein [Chthoniobacterales bacterium]|jgi:small-conductance mechanosensitive channel|nr:mechanosensitive ion channel family protein [Chthoniobacterales bacterium]
MPESKEQVEQKPEVKKELARTTDEKKPGEKVKAAPTDKFWFATHGLLLIGCAVLYWLIGSKFLPLIESEVSLSHRLIRGAALIIIVLATAKAVRVYAIGRIDDNATRFTLRRILLLISGLLIAVITVSVVFVNWYGALTALGVGSIIVGLAVQTPMKSFIAWIYILVRQPFRVGDRIKIGDATGDVIDVGYLDTTLWEFGGQYMTGDHPSGRIIRFPNEKVLDEIVWNYSWPLFPYIWNEIKLNVAYQSDLKFIAETMQRVVEEDLGEEMMQRIDVYREVLARTPVDELQVRERPRVIFRVDNNTWIDAIVRYVVPPRESGPTKSRLIPKLLAALNEAPGKVMFPKGDAR